MSRIGKKPVPVPAGVKVLLSEGSVTVEGPRSKLSQALPPDVALEVKEGAVLVSAATGSRRASAMQGLARSLVNNMVEGVTKGFRKDLEIVGVGYKAAVSGSKMTLSLGYSHPVVYNVPQGIKVSVADNVKISVEGADKQLVGEVAATIRRFKKPEPYKGKGIRYAGERIAMKEGKTVG